MKHLLNNMSESEKKAIREQHVGGMRIINEKFDELLNSKLGNVRPILEEPQQFFKIQTQVTNIKNGRKTYFDITDVIPASDGCEVQALPRGSYSDLAKFLDFRVNQGVKFVFDFNCDTGNRVKINEKKSPGLFDRTGYYKEGDEYTIDNQDALRKIYNRCGCKKYTGQKYGERLPQSQPNEPTRPETIPTQGQPSQPPTPRDSPRI